MGGAGFILCAFHPPLRQSCGLEAERVVGGVTRWMLVGRRVEEGAGGGGGGRRRRGEPRGGTFLEAQRGRGGGSMRIGGCGGGEMRGASDPPRSRTLARWRGLPGILIIASRGDLARA